VIMDVGRANFPTEMRSDGVDGVLDVSAVEVVGGDGVERQTIWPSSVHCEIECSVSAAKVLVKVIRVKRRLVGVCSQQFLINHSNLSNDEVVEVLASLDAVVSVAAEFLPFEIVLIACQTVPVEDSDADVDV